MTIHCAVVVQLLCIFSTASAQQLHSECTASAQQTPLWYLPGIVFPGRIYMIFWLSKITGLKLVITNIIKIMIIDLM